MLDKFAKGLQTTFGRVYTFGRQRPIPAAGPSLRVHLRYQVRFATLRVHLRYQVRFATLPGTLFVMGDNN
jgi:hypothetical protein